MNYDELVKSFGTELFYVDKFCKVNLMQLESNRNGELVLFSNKAAKIAALHDKEYRPIVITPWHYKKIFDCEEEALRFALEEIEALKKPIEERLNELGEQ